MSWSLPKLRQLTDTDVRTFRTRGFVIVEKLLDEARIAALRARFPLLFAGKFDTGVYPDEWYWREGMSLPDVTRHMGNAWKADLTVASYGLSEDIGRAAAQLNGWDGARIAQDTIWWKAPKTKPIAYHQDSSFMDFLDPPNTTTCWLTLDDTEADAGTLEYVPGSHRWPLTPIPDQFHGVEDFRAAMKHAASAAGIVPPEPYIIQIPAGSCVFHIGEIWHGSGPNTRSDIMRRSIGVHMIRPEARFSNRPGGYIFRRYQLTGDDRLDESFFPILWTKDGKRTAWIDEYCRTGRRLPQTAAAHAAE
ncbi:MAG: phytanoyl-CoA dioxygenase family protein [Alphaproteobacteria bacterium]